LSSSDNFEIGSIQHKPTDDYFVVVTRKGRQRVWQWQIQGRPPKGARLYEVGFKTEFEARLAGEKALRAMVSPMRKQ
jgi:hypothetical protein